MSNLTLYEIGSELGVIINEVKDAGGEITDEQWALMEKTMGALEKKSDGYGHVRETMRSVEAAMKERIVEMTNRLSAVSNMRLNLEKRIYDVMIRLDLQKIEGVEFTFSIRKNPPKLVGPDGKNVNPHELPEEYVETEIVLKLITDKIKQALKNGETVKGMRLVQGTRLHISK